MVSMLSGTCDLCGAELPKSVLDAADLLYGLEGLGFAERLRTALERAVKRADTDPLLSTDQERDRVAAESALLDVLGLADFGSLALAYRHYGNFGECRK